jgi:hemoglobin-like flavoprotein
MAKHVFGFPHNIDLQPAELKKNPFFLEHSSSLIKVIEEALNMLVSAGPESSQLSVVLHDLGKKHSRMAVDESMFTVMGKSLIETMRGMIGHRKFSNAMEKSWEVVFNVLAAEMIHGMNTDKIVLSTWAKLKTVEEWQQKAGLILYQHMFEHCPETKAVFGFSVDLDIDTEALKSNPAFRMHSEYFMMMVDKAMGMMEAQTFNEHMSLLGLKHVGLGVAPEHFAYMGEALFHALETLLQDHFDEKSKLLSYDERCPLKSIYAACLSFDPILCDFFLLEH